MELSFSLRDLELLARSNVPTQIQLGMMLASSHSERRSHLEKAIDWISFEFSKTRQDRQGRSEDALTGDVVFGLQCMGFQASHDTKIGGHCDVVVEGTDNFLWLGEAKIHSSYDWLISGFQQLDTRYATALPGQDYGGIIIFCYNENTLALMHNWRDRLCESRPDVQAHFDAANPLILHTSHTHSGSGLPFHVRHTPISLHFKPQDKR